MLIIAYLLEKSCLKVAVLKKARKHIKIEHLQTFDSAEKSFETLKTFLNQKNTKSLSALTSSDVLLREVSLALKNKSALKKVLPFQIESLLPFPLEDAVVSPQIHSRGKETDVKLFIAKKQSLESHIEALKNLQINPDRVSCVPSALFHYAQFSAPEKKDLVLFHIGEEKITYIAIGDNQLLLSQTLPLGHGALTKELERAHAFLMKKVSCTEMVVTGNPEIKEMVQNYFKPHFSLVECPHPEYAVPLGLGYEEKMGGVQFLEKVDSPLKAKKLIQSTLVSSLGLSLILLVGGLTLQKKKENYLLDRLPSTEEKNLASALKAYEKKLKMQKKVEGFPLSVPLVSDFLGWIGAQHQLEGINITQVRYQLLQNEAQIALIFNALTPRHADAFYQLLKASDSPVNTGLPMSWTNENNQYTTSFTLVKK